MTKAADTGDREARPRLSLGFGGLSAAGGDHIAHFYSSRQEWRDLLFGYLLAGITAGDKCIYIMRSGPESEVARRALEGANGAIGDALSTGQLMFHEGDKPGGMQALLADALEDVPGRYPWLRWGGDMTWSLSKCATPELMEWESHCNGFPQSPVVFLCQYELESFRGDVVMDAMRTHPLCVVGNAILRNPYYIEPEVFLEELRSAASARQLSPDDEPVQGKE